jgi:hypothetical protein
MRRSVGKRLRSVCYRSSSSCHAVTECDEVRIFRDKKPRHQFSKGCVAVVFK